MKAAISSLLSLLVLCSLLGCGTPPTATAPRQAVVLHALAKQNEPINRYGNKDYPQTWPSRPLREIANLPATITQDLKTLSTRAIVAGDRAVDTSTDGLRVKYIKGVNHPHHALTEHGADESPTRPAKGTYYTEHCFDLNGKLVKSIANREDGTRVLAKTFLYEDDRPSSMLSYLDGRYVGGNFGLYRDGKLCLVASINAEGRVSFCECIFYIGEAEDYYARYVAKRTKEPLTAADLYLTELSLLGSSDLRFNEAGELTEIRLYTRPIKAE